jgi:hypothetical protein
MDYLKKGSATSVGWAAKDSTVPLLTKDGTQVGWRTGGGTRYILAKEAGAVGWALTQFALAFYVHTLSLVYGGNTATIVLYSDSAAQITSASQIPANILSSVTLTGSAANSTVYQAAGSAVAGYSSYSETTVQDYRITIQRYEPLYSSTSFATPGNYAYMPITSGTSAATISPTGDHCYTSVAPTTVLLSGWNVYSGSYAVTESTAGTMSTATQYYAGSTTLNKKAYIGKTNVGEVIFSQSAVAPTSISDTVTTGVYNTPAGAGIEYTHSVTFATANGNKTISIKDSNSAPITTSNYQTRLTNMNIDVEINDGTTAITNYDASRTYYTFGTQTLHTDIDSGLYLSGTPYTAYPRQAIVAGNIYVASSSETGLIKNKNQQSAYVVDPHTMYGKAGTYSYSAAGSYISGYSSRALMTGTNKQHLGNSNLQNLVQSTYTPTVTSITDTVTANNNI